jgi:hypothetical protein
MRFHVLEKVLALNATKSSIGTALRDEVWGGSQCQKNENLPTWIGNQEALIIISGMVKAMTPLSISAPRGNLKDFIEPLSKVFSPVSDHPLQSPNPTLEDAPKLIKSSIVK